MKEMEILTTTEQERSDSLRERMDDAGCVFQFCVMQVAPGVTIDETVHRLALRGLHQQLTAEALDWHRKLIQNPQYADRPEPEIDWAQDKAIAQEVPTSELGALIGIGEGQRPSLYRAFIEPPYGTRFNGGEEEALTVFREWIDLLGLVKADQPQVIDWVSDLTLNHENDVEPWSHYFADGLEWWGVWCLTIWNPRSRTLSALIASTTD